MRNLAQSEGRVLQALVEEAFVDLIAKRTQGKPHAHEMAAYQASLEKYGSLYKKLANSTSPYNRIHRIPSRSTTAALTMEGGASST